MTIGMPDELSSFDQRAVIKVCGVGGGGGNAVARMIEEGLKEVEFITVNTDAQALKRSPAGVRLQIGVEITGGLGSGAQPSIGRQAAEDDRERLSDVLGGADMVFVTAGLGGGTGTGAAPIVGEISRSTGALTVGIVTLPFSFEGKERMDNALEGLAELEKHVDTIIVVPNDSVERLCRENVAFLDAFRRADEVLHNGVRAISELITVSGLINLDFADVRTIMQSRGRALMGIGVAEGEDRAVRAAEEAIVCPLLEQSNIHGAKAVIANVRGGSDIGMREIQAAVSTVQQAAHPDANIIFGAVVDDEHLPELQVTVIAAGFDRAVSDADLTGGGMLERESIEIRSETIPFEPRTRAPEQEEKVEKEVASPVLSKTSVDAAPQVEYLFPQDEAETPQLARAEPDEDLSIPAFMRKRKRGT